MSYSMARAVWENEPCRFPFHQCLLWHLRCGFVFSTPDAFLMGRPVRRDAGYDDITDPRVAFKDPDAWLVYVAAGRNRLAWFLACEPYPLPWIGWERDNRLRFYNREQVTRHVARRQSSQNDRLFQGRRIAAASAASAGANDGSRKFQPVAFGGPAAAGLRIQPHVVGQPDRGACGPHDVVSQTVAG